MLLPLALALAGCGSGNATVGGCLNNKSFLVQEQNNIVRGSSPGGVNFTLTLYPTRTAATRAHSQLPRSASVELGDAVVDFAGNPAAAPGGAPGKLSRSALETIAACLARP